MDSRPKNAKTGNKISHKEKEPSIYNLKQIPQNPAELTSFNSSSGYFNGFRHNYNFQSLHPSGKAMSADEESTK